MDKMKTNYFSLITFLFLIYSINTFGISAPESYVQEEIPYPALKQLVRGFGIETPMEYIIWAMEENIPGIPLRKLPLVYVEEWEGWEKFLGSSNKILKPKEVARRIISDRERKQRRLSSFSSQPQEMPAKQTAEAVRRIEKTAQKEVQSNRQQKKKPVQKKIQNSRQQKKKLKNVIEMPQAIEEYNEQTKAGEKIIGFGSYQRFYHRIPGAPAYSYLKKLYKRLYGAHPKEKLSDFLFKNLTDRRLRLEEMPQAINEYNKKAKAGEKITGFRSYEKFYHRIPGAPSYSTLGNWYKKRNGAMSGLSDYIFRSCSTAFVKETSHAKVHS